MHQVTDESALNPALMATVETALGMEQVRIRPLHPMPYFQAQDFSVVLSFESLDALFDLCERAGYRRNR